MHCAAKLRFFTLIAFLASIAAARLGPAGEPLLFDDVLLDPAGDYAEPVTADETEPPFRQYAGDPLRFDFEQSTAVKEEEIPADSAFDEAVEDWGQFNVGKLPTQEGDIIFSDARLLFSDGRQVDPPVSSTPAFRRHWSLLATSAGLVLLLVVGGSLVWFRGRALSENS